MFKCASTRCYHFGDLMAVSHNNFRIRMAKEEEKKRRKAKDHSASQEHEIGYNETTNTNKTSIGWQRVKYVPTVPPNENLKLTRHPTPEEVTCACQMVDSTFFLLHSGRCVITDPKDHKSIIAVIEFTPWEQLTEKDKDNLNFLSSLLHGSKEFINPVALSKIVGRYIKKFEADQRKKYKEHFQQSGLAGEVIGHYFQEMASVPFKKNQYIMKQFNIPSFSSLRHDAADISDYTFVLFLLNVSDDPCYK
ncbi:hypothetical protein VP01_105g11 [Puccinia sorghi]|uniref:Tet-like 2OG-Fe(II) oxygenase domain-containing protein n=1 Tax=Puccinia sorghi TaxID=27349 RepID=A0A0L6VU71_9BASI|nr:hypothetical protein VP01_105g11 [Puccinia sorghi]